MPPITIDLPNVANVLIFFVDTVKCVWVYDKGGDILALNSVYRVQLYPSIQYYLKFKHINKKISNTSRLALLYINSDK